MGDASGLKRSLLRCVRPRFCVIVIGDSDKEIAPLCDGEIEDELRKTRNGRGSRWLVCVRPRRAKLC